MDGLLCNPSVLSFFKPPRSGERVQGTMFPAGVWGLESRARCAGFSVTEIGNRRERLRVREAGSSAAGRGRRPHASFPDQSPITPLDGLHRNPSALPFLQAAAKRRGESEGQSSLRRGLGRQPHHSPPFPSSSPRHSMRTFRPSIIAARALRENASNCLSVICSIRLSGFTEPAAVVLAVGTP